jgi:hypothetical protein
MWIAKREEFKAGMGGRDLVAGYDVRESIRVTGRGIG